MPSGIAILGHSTRDHHVKPDFCVVDDGRLSMRCGARWYSFPWRGWTLPGAKSTVASIPIKLYAEAEARWYGGGGLHAAKAARRLAPSLPVRYLDSCLADGGLAAELAALGIETRSLGLR